MRRDQRESEGSRIGARSKEIAHAGNVAERFRHLVATHLEVGAVHPGADERLPCRCLRLRDLILMVGEDQVDRAGVNIDLLTKVAHAHRRALQVPAGAARSDRSLPRWLTRFCRLPQDKVAHVILAVLIRHNALPDPHRLRIKPSQCAVGRPRGDTEED